MQQTTLLMCKDKHRKKEETHWLFTVYGKRSFLGKESDTLTSHRVYISPTMSASSALIQIEWLFT